MKSDITLPVMVLFSLANVIFGAGGFYLLTSWRIKKLEDHNDNNNDIRERLIRIETIITDKISKL